MGKAQKHDKGKVSATIKHAKEDWRQSYQLIASAGYSMSKAKDRMSRYSSPPKIDHRLTSQCAEIPKTVQEQSTSSILYASASNKSSVTKTTDKDGASVKGLTCTMSFNSGVCVKSLVPSAARERSYFHTYDLGVVELSGDLRAELEPFLDRRQTYPFSLIGAPSQNDVKVLPEGGNQQTSVQMLTPKAKTTKPTYFCTTCGQKFIQKGQLYDHELLHLSQVDKRRGQDLICTFPSCGRKFTKPSHLERHSRLHLDINDLNALSSRDQASQAAVPMGKYGSPRTVSVPQNVVDVSVDVIGSAAVPSVLDCLVKKSLAEISFDTSPHQQGNGKTGTKYSVAQSKGEAAKNKKSNRVFKCDFCDKCFSQSGNLSRHRVIHMKLRPFKCDECGKGFTQKSHLKTHCNVHTGLKKYQCQICDKKFSQLGHLKTHVGIHKRAALEQRSISCDQCEKTFIQTCDRDKHIQTAHKKAGDARIPPQQQSVSVPEVTSSNPPAPTRTIGSC